MAISNSRSSSISTSDPIPPRARRGLALALLGLVLPLLTGIRLPDERPYAPSPDNWLLVMEQRVRARARTITEPKVLFIGGSSLLFGIRAQSLGERLNRPVVNYGMIVQVGLDLIAERAVELIRPGDWVVVAAEYSHFYVPATNDNWRIAWQDAGKSELSLPWWHDLWSRERARRRCAPVPGWLALPEHLFSEGGRHAVSSGSGSPYEVAAYSPDGELIHKRPEPMGTLLDMSPPDDEQPNFSDSWGVRGFERIRTVCRERGATLVAMPAPRVTVPKAHNRAAEFERRWLDFAAAQGARLLMSQGENALPGRTYGYDTEYHLNDAGVRLMEERLAVALLKLLQESTVTAPATGVGNAATNTTPP